MTLDYKLRLESPICKISYHFHPLERFPHVSRLHWALLDTEHYSTKVRSTRTRISWSCCRSQVHMFLREGNSSKKIASNVFGTGLRLTKAAMEVGSGAAEEKHYAHQQG